MKAISFITVLFLTTQLFGQSWEQKFEQAAYESKNENTVYYTTTITLASSIDNNLFETASVVFKNKEGVFNFKLGQKENTIIVYHKDFIVFETIKELLRNTAENLNFELSEPNPFLF